MKAVFFESDDVELEAGFNLGDKVVRCPTAAFPHVIKPPSTPLKGDIIFCSVPNCPNRGKEIRLVLNGEPPLIIPKNGNSDRHHIDRNQPRVEKHRPRRLINIPVHG